MNIGSVIMSKRKALGYTQQTLADKLNVSFQAVSKWENGTNYPEMEMLPMIASVLDTSIDSLLGYKSFVISDYDKRYDTADYYWGITPNNLCYEIMKLRPPVKPLKVLDLGCGEGKDAVFFAKCGYAVTAFDLSEQGIEKAKKLAEHNKVEVRLFKADVFDYSFDMEYDIIFSSGLLHFLPQTKRKELCESMKKYTANGGINALNVFVQKPFIKCARDSTKDEEKRHLWYSGELFEYYHDWMFHTCREEIFDCNSGGIPHKHCMDTLIAQKVG